MPSIIKIAVDAMGGDDSPDKVINGIINHHSYNKDVFYKITRTADDVTVINYSTGSGAKYSKLSYDISGSYFDFDMSILEPNYQYEICFLRQEGTRYIQQKEKFRFRVEKY